MGCFEVGIAPLGDRGTAGGPSPGAGIAPLGDRGAGSWLAGSVGDRGAALEVAHTGELRMSAPSPTGSPFQGLVDVLAVCVILGASVFC